MRILFYMLQELFEPHDELRSNIAECGLLVAIDFEVAKAASPVAPVSFRFRVLATFFDHFSVIFQKWSVLLKLMGERILSILQLNQTFGLNRLCCGQRLSVLFLFQRCFCIYQVQLQIFFVALAVPIDVKKQTHIAVRQLLFTKFDGFFLGGSLLCHICLLF